MVDQKSERYRHLGANIRALCALRVRLVTLSYGGDPARPANIQGSLLNNSTAGVPVFSQYLKSQHYPVWKINVYPTGSNGVQILVILICAWGSDSLLTGCRWPFLMAGAVSRQKKTFEPHGWEIQSGTERACIAP